MTRRIFLTLANAVLATLTLGTIAVAQEQLTATEIDDLLRGNTIEGVWAGSSYTQYFAESGLTIYIPDGGRPDEGRWRANHETNEYESWWRSTGWTPYVMVRTEDGAYAYMNGQTPEPFTVKAGKHID